MLPIIPVSYTHLDVYKRQMLISVAKVVIKNEEWRMMNEELRMNNGEKQEQQKTIINNTQRAVNKLCHSLTSAVHRSLFYLQFAIYHILFIIPSSPSATPIMIRLLQSV